MGATEGLNISQGYSETSGIHFNGDYIAMWSPCDSYALRYFDEDNGSELFYINSSGYLNISRVQSDYTSATYLYAGNKFKL